MHRFAEPAGRRRKGASLRAARIRRLRERLQTETDPKARAVIEAQFVALDWTFRP